MSIYFFPGLIAAAIIYFLTVLFFDLLLRGFSPFIPSRPWVVKQIISEMAPLREDSKVCALSCGRSGYFYALSKKYPKAEMTGVEMNIFPYIVAKLQTILRGNRIKVIKRELHRVNVNEFDLIYCHLYPDQMRELWKKLKFECKPGAKVISTGFIIPRLNPTKVVEFQDGSGKFDFLSKNQKLFQSKKKKYRKENKAFYYEI